MSHPNTLNNEQCLRCMHCMKVVKCSRYDTTGLVRHIEQDHPEIFAVASARIKNLHKLASDHGISEDRLSQISKMTGLSESQMAEEAERYMARKNCSVHWSGEPEKSKKVPTATCKVSATKDHPCTCGKNEAMSTRKQCFKSSVHQWCASNGSIFCPACCSKRRPVIKAASELQSGWCANCWPLRLLPCLSTTDNREYLYCSKCNIFLGIYNPDTKSVRPNREFVLNNVPKNQ
ncbi:uncharacterized protein LOC108045318 [Drosophila rhopaloa]|uniref:Uncharacterized protein LOC108045318 n=1 Tax=Drosophila rhopaloa TaxID=1041015 RepID=A0A6P4EY91_DRORH|nr:uncharacterized protein LOC108045318 [Drosophila rhopaloa]